MFEPNFTRLAPAFTKYGYVFTLVERGERWAIFSQEVGSRISAYEVVRVRLRKASHFRGKTYPPAESYPAESAWGKDGWTFSCFGGVVPQETALSQARAKAAELNTAPKKQEFK